MAGYRIIVAQSVYKDLDGITNSDVRRLVPAIEGLAEAPRPPQSRKLSGEEKYRLRCGVYRVLYEIRDTELVVFGVRAGHTACS